MCESGKFDFLPILTLKGRSFTVFSTIQVVGILPQTKGISAELKLQNTVASVGFAGTPGVCVAHQT